MAACPRIATTRLGLCGQEVLQIELRFDECIPTCLTAAEAEVAFLLLAGLSDQEIAWERRTSVRTVANQLQSIYEKLGLGSRAELVGHLARRLVAS